MSNRCRAMAAATRELSTVIHRRPHCSATNAVVPLPHVGSSTRSPGSVVINMQRWIIFVAVWTTYTRSLAPPVSSQTLVKADCPKSVLKRRYRHHRRCNPNTFCFEQSTDALLIGLPTISCAWTKDTARILDLELLCS